MSESAGAFFREGPMSFFRYYIHPNHTGDVTSAGDGATTIANDAVTNAKLANMAEATIKGRQAAAGTGDPEDLTAAQARTALGIAATDVVTHAGGVFNGQVLINAALSTSSNSLILTNGIANNTDKTFRAASPHRSNAEQPTAIFVGNQLSADNPLFFGGGSGQLTARTRQCFFTATATTTTFGTNRGGFTNDGSFILGNMGSASGGTHDPTANGVSTLVMIQKGTSPTLAAQTGAVYVKDVGGTAEVLAMDAAGNEQQLTPHPVDMIDAHETLMLSVGLTPVAIPWAYDSTNYYAGKRITADIAAALRCIEWLMGQAGRPIQLLQESDIAADQVRDWDAVQQQQLQRSIELRQQWESEKTESLAKAEQIARDAVTEKRELTEDEAYVVNLATGYTEPPPPYEVKQPPAWLKQRIDGIKAKRNGR